MVKRSTCLSGLFFLIHFFSFTQDRGYEIGVEVAAARATQFGGTFGGSLKFGVVDKTDESSLIYGPSFRYQYFWNQNPIAGTAGSGSIWGGGGFVHFRFFEWFFLGADVEATKNPFLFVNPDKRWSLSSFIGGGLHHDFNIVKLNLGIMYDVADAIRERLSISNPSTYNPSPFRPNYFIRRQDPNQPGVGGGYLPIIYRITFFFDLGGK